MSEGRAAELARALEALAELIAERVAARQGEARAREGEPAEASPWLSVSSAARYLDWPVGRLYKLTARGEIPHYKQEGRLLFRRDELDRWLQGFAQGREATG